MLTRNQKGKIDKIKPLDICKNEAIRTAHTDEENDKGTKDTKKPKLFVLIMYTSLIFFKIMLT